MVNDTNQMWRTLLPGGVSATTSVLFGYPIDTVKTDCRRDVPQCDKLCGRYDEK